MKTCKVSDLFSVEYGNGLELVSLETSKYGYNFVARGEKNNGVSAIVNNVIGERLFPKGCITVAVSGSVMESFLQPAPFYTAYHVMVLTPLNPMTDAEKLFYCMCLRANKFKYSYGRQANETLASLQIPKLEEIPDEIKTFSMDRHADEMRSVLDFDALAQKASHHDDNSMVPLHQLFDVKNGIASSEVVRLNYKKNNNWLPYIRPSYRQSTSIDAYVNRYAVPQDKIFPKGTLYVSTDGQGSHSYAYVSVSDFIPNSNTCVLLPRREMCLREKLSYALYITFNRYKFSYGRKPKGDRLKKILLPASIPEEWNNTNLNMTE